jgi:hypothetical protein
VYLRQGFSLAGILARFGQAELLKFIEKRFINGKYARNPLNFANAMAGLPSATGVPFLGVWQSYDRCSNLPCSLWPQFQFRVFETIESIWNMCRKSPESPMELFPRQIRTLRKTEAVSTPGQSGQGTSERCESYLRSYLMENWSFLRRAIERAFEASAKPERMPFIIFSNFGKILAEPRSAAGSVLAAAEKIED